MTATERIISSLIARPVSRIVLGITLWMTWEVTKWAFAFADKTAHIGGYDVAATIAAVTAPFAALQAAVFRIYTEGKFK